MIAEPRELPLTIEPAKNYLSRTAPIRSWLLTTDHKRIGLL